MKELLVPRNRQFRVSRCGTSHFGAGLRRSWRVASLGTTAALFMTGISSASLEPSSSASQLPRHTAVAKFTAPSVVNLAFTADMGVPDPDIFYSVEGNVVMTSVYEGLVQYANNSSKIVPALATSWTISPNGSTYTFQLRPHVMFHDGNGPMTSADVEASFKRREDLGEVHAAGKQYFNDHPDITGSQLYTEVVRLAGERGWTFGNFHCGHLIGEFPHQLFEGERNDSMITSVNSGPMRRTDPSGRVGHWILEVHLIDQAREIGGFYEELLTIPTDVAALPFQKGTK